MRERREGTGTSCSVLCTGNCQGSLREHLGHWPPVQRKGRGNPGRQMEISQVSLPAAKGSVSFSPLRGWHHNNRVSPVRLLIFYSDLFTFVECVCWNRSRSVTDFPDCRLREVMQPQQLEFSHQSSHIGGRREQIPHGVLCPAHMWGWGGGAVLAEPCCHCKFLSIWKVLSF